RAGRSMSRGAPTSIASMLWAWHPRDYGDRASLDWQREGVGSQFRGEPVGPCGNRIRREIDSRPDSRPLRVTTRFILTTPVRLLKSRIIHPFSGDTHGPFPRSRKNPLRRPEVEEPAFVPPLQSRRGGGREEDAGPF